ncbi:MAG: AraC family transcriptional regulator ligand-binding domain-containing protein [Hyphomicrobiales bacterium]
MAKDALPPAEKDNGAQTSSSMTDPRALTGDKHDQNNDADRFLIHARALAGLLAHAEKQGLSSAVMDEELAKLRLNDVRSDSFDGFISMNRFAKLMRRIGKLLNDEAIGLHVADHIDLGSMGTFGMAVVSAPNLDQALQVLCRYMRLYADVSFAATVIGEKEVEFNWAYSPLIAAHDVLCDRAARLFKVRMRVLFGEAWEPRRIYLQRPKPRDLRPYRQALCSALTFDAPMNRIVLRRSDLDLPNVHANANTHEIAIALADRMMAERRIPDDLSIRAREDILHHLADEGPNMNETARRLGTSPRSLQRRLEELGTTYQQLSDDVRRALADELLKQTSLPMGEIAFRLGFANQANLTRASKRWFGLSPRQVRAQEA